MATSPWIVLVDFNGLDDTRRCLQSLMALDCPASIVVVDNSSKVLVEPHLAPEFPGVHFVRSEVNGGWAGGNNLGLHYAYKHGADYIILLNNDTIVAPDLVSRLVLAAESNPTYGVIGPVIRFMDPPSEVQTDGVLYNRPGVPGFFQREKVPLTTTNPPSVIPVDIVNGCCMMIRRAVVDRIGEIDPAFFLVHEESDYCLRAQAAGFTNGVIAEALVWHKGSSTFQREGKSLPRYYDCRNLLLLFMKHGRHLKSRGLFSSIIHHFRYTYHRYAIERDTGFDKTARAILEGFYDGWCRRFGPKTDRPRFGFRLLEMIFAGRWRLTSRRT